MALFVKNTKEETLDVELEIRTNNSWFNNGVPSYIIRNVIPDRDKHKTLELISNKGQGYLNPVISLVNYVKLVETDETLELTSKGGFLIIIPKSQILELRYFTL